MQAPAPGHWSAQSWQPPSWHRIRSSPRPASPGRRFTPEVADCATVRVAANFAQEGRKEGPSRYWGHRLFPSQETIYVPNTLSMLSPWAQQSPDSPVAASAARAASFLNANDPEAHPAVALVGKTAA